MQQQPVRKAAGDALARGGAGERKQEGGKRERRPAVTCLWALTFLRVGAEAHHSQGMVNPFHASSSRGHAPTLVHPVIAGSLAVRVLPLEDAGVNADLHRTVEMDHL